MNWAYVWVGLKKFIPATDYISAIEVARRLQNEGFTPIINLLGEHYTDRKKVDTVVTQYKFLLSSLRNAGVRAKISIKPTQIGLEISKETYKFNIIQIIRRAHIENISLEIDIESFYYLNDTIDVFLEISGDFDVRQAIQAYLQRSKKDIKELISRRRKVRLVKGAYAEGDLSKSETRTQMKNFMEQLLLCGNEPAIATIKDEELINDIFKFASQRGVSNNRFIIQTLYGVRNDLKNKWRNKGFRVEVYVPVGPWHKALPYIWRRVKEILKKR